jgi:hypothetical protein
MFSASMRGGAGLLFRAAVDREVVEQLRVWAVELADEADAVERRASSAPASSPKPSAPRPLGTATRHGQKNVSFRRFEMLARC